MYPSLQILTFQFYRQASYAKEITPLDFCFHDFEMTIVSNYILKNIQGKTIYLRGDQHAESRADLGGVDGLLSEIKVVLSDCGNAFIEFGEYLLDNVLLSEDKGENNGMYYRIPFLLSQLPDQSGLCMNDIRACAASAPLISWCNFSLGNQKSTIATWKLIDDRFVEAKNRIDDILKTPENKILWEVTSKLFKPIEKRWFDIKKIVMKHYLKLDTCIDPGNNKIEIEDLKWDEDKLILMQLYEVGLLCDMEQWFGEPGNSCIIYCGYLHVENLLEPFKNLGFTKVPSP